MKTGNERRTENDQNDRKGGDNDDDDICTAQERVWAIRIKQAAAATATAAAAKNDDVNNINSAIDIDKISDLEFLQHAIVSKGNVDVAMRRISKLQAFRNKYGIQTSLPSLSLTMENAERDLIAFLAAHGGLYLSISAVKEKEDATHIICVEYSRVKARSFTSNESWAIRMRGLYHFWQALHPNVPAMRAGMVSLCNMQGFSVYHNFSWTNHRRFADFVSHCYPARVQQIALLNINRIVMMVNNMTKHFISKKIQQRYVFHGNLLEFLKTSDRFPKEALPKEWGGVLDSSNESVLSMVLEKLRQRHTLEETFRLCPDDENDDDDDDEA